jgi:SynChlorMet cassette protein ScmC
MDSQKMISNGRLGYPLRLGNGQQWHLTATAAAAAWLDGFASILELRTGAPRGEAQLIFLGPEPDGKEHRDPVDRVDSDILEALPRQGWIARNVSALTLWTHPAVPHVICELGPEDDHAVRIIRMWQALDPIYQRVQKTGGLPLHAALLEWEGSGVLLAAPGARGKTTCCRRLPSPWHALCDDETLIVRDEHGPFRAHPFPTWGDCLSERSQRTWHAQRFLPLSAIFFLERGETDQAVPLGQGETATYLTQSATVLARRTWKRLYRQDKHDRRRALFVNACDLARAVPAFTLRTTQKGRFWNEMERVLSLSCHCHTRPRPETQDRAGRGDIREESPVRHP